MSLATLNIEDITLNGLSSTEVMSTVSAAMWKAGVDEDVIAAYCLRLRECAPEDDAVVITREWLAKQ